MSVKYVADKNACGIERPEFFVDAKEQGESEFMMLAVCDTREEAEHIYRCLLEDHPEDTFRIMHYAPTAIAHSEFKPL